MENSVDRLAVNAGEEQGLPIRCSDCGGTIGKGRELVADENRFLCESCYKMLIHPGGSGDIPSRWG